MSLRSQLVGGWLTNMKVSWDYYSQLNGKIKHHVHVPNTNQMIVIWGGIVILLAKMVIELGTMMVLSGNGDSTVKTSNVTLWIFAAEKSENLGRMTTFENRLPSGNHTKSYWKWPMYSWFTYSRWWFSIVMLVYQRVQDVTRMTWDQCWRLSKLKT